MSTTAPVRKDLPTSKKECQRVLRSFGYRGLKIDSIENGDGEARVYALTGPVLRGDGQMRRQAKTIVFLFGDEEVHVSSEDGWVVG